MPAVRHWHRIGNVLGITKAERKILFIGRTHLVDKRPAKRPFLIQIAFPHFGFVRMGYHLILAVHDNLDIRFTMDSQFLRYRLQMPQREIHRGHAFDITERLG